MRVERQFWPQPSCCATADSGLLDRRTRSLSILAGYFFAAVGGEESTVSMGFDGAIGDQDGDVVDEGVGAGALGATDLLAGELERAEADGAGQVFQVGWVEGRGL